MDMSNDTATFISKKLAQREDYRMVQQLVVPDMDTLLVVNPRITTVYRLDYANDNTDASPKGPLPRKKKF